MTPVDLTEIPASDGFAFERLVEALLEALGWSILIRAGKGADGGRDILAQCIEVTGSGRSRPRTYVIQCKHTAHSGRSVATPDLAAIAVVPAKHGATGWLLVTSTRLTSDAAETIAAARTAVPSTEFDSWDALTLDSRLREDACRDLLRQFFPRSFAALSHILTPSATEIRDLIEKAIEANPSLSSQFAYTPEIDSPESLISLATSKQWTIESIREMLADAECILEVLTIWTTSRRRGTGKASLLLLLHALGAMATARRRGIPLDARRRLVDGQTGTLALYRSYVRDSWKQFVAAHGNPVDWTSFTATSENSYFPPLPLAGIRMLVSCAGREEVSTGSIRLGDGEAEVRFVAAFALESVVELRCPMVEPITFEYRVDPGGDPVDLAIVAFSHHGDDWNTLL